MIWVAGKILPDDGLSISVLDRTFEHGLGLFETLRTWGGRPALLDRHKARMLRSARELKVPIDPASLPDDKDVRALLDAERVKEDWMLRITASGGTASGNSVVWMRSSPLPPPIREGGAVVFVNSWSREREPDGGREFEARSAREEAGFTSRHKTLNYWFKRVAYEQARDRGYDETLILVEPWGFVEASRSNLFLIADDTLMTVGTEAPIVPGIMRQMVLDIAEELQIEIREVIGFALEWLKDADEIFLTNAVRGIIPVARIDGWGRTIELQAPGHRTKHLQQFMGPRLWPDRGGETP